MVFAPFAFALAFAFVPRPLFDLRGEWVLLNVDGLVLALHRIVEKEQVAVGDAQRG